MYDSELVEPAGDTKLCRCSFNDAVFLEVLSANGLFLLVARGVKCIEIKHTHFHSPEMKIFCLAR
jgi:hypothetical protein